MGLIEEIGHCKDCKHCNDKEEAEIRGCSNDCAYMNACDPIGGTNYFKRG